VPMRFSYAWRVMLFALLMMASEARAGDDVADKKTVRRLMKDVEQVPSLYAKGEQTPKYKSLPRFPAQTLAQYTSAKDDSTEKELETWKLNKTAYARTYPLRAATFAAAMDVHDIMNASIALVLDARALPPNAFDNGRVKFATLMQWNLGCLCERDGMP